MAPCEHIILGTTSNIYDNSITCLMKRKDDKSRKQQRKEQKGNMKGVEENREKNRDKTTE